MEGLLALALALAAGVAAPPRRAGGLARLCAVADLPRAASSPTRARRASRRQRGGRRSPRPAGCCSSCRRSGCARPASRSCRWCAGTAPNSSTRPCQGRGVVFLTPHLGCFEVTAQAYAERFGAAHGPITVLYRPARKAWLRGLVGTRAGAPGAGDGTGVARRRAPDDPRAAPRRGRRPAAGPGPAGRARRLGAVLRPAGLHHDPGRAARAADRRGAARRLGRASATAAPASSFTLAAFDEVLPGDPAAQAESAAVVNRAMERLIRRGPSNTSGATTATRRRRGVRSTPTPDTGTNTADGRTPPARDTVAAALAAARPAGRHRSRPRPRCCMPRPARGAASRCATSSCAFPSAAMPSASALVREHFLWLGRSILERGVLWYASPARLRRLIRIEGDVRLAERSERPVMWLVPHFVGLDVAGASVLLFQNRQGRLDLPGAEQRGDGRGAAPRPAAPGQCRDLRAHRCRQAAAAGDPPRRRLLQPARHGLRRARRRLRAVLRHAGGDAAGAVAPGHAR